MTVKRVTAAPFMQARSDCMKGCVFRPEGKGPTYQFNFPRKIKLLVAQPVDAAAVRTHPGNAVARHAPEIFLHAVLTNLKTAPAGPTKRHPRAAAMAHGGFGAPPSSAPGFFIRVT
jgi:hypothetical protein